MNYSDFILNLPEIILLVGALLTLLTDLFIPKRFSLVTFGVCQLSLLLSSYFIYANFWLPVSFSFNNMLVHDQLASFLQLAVCTISFFVFLFARRYMKEQKLQEGEFFTLALLCILGMAILVSANHLLVVFLALELSSLPLYALVAINRDSSVSTEAAMKYYLMGTVASGILLYGFSLIYGLTDSFYLQTIFHVLQTSQNNQAVLIVALTFILGSVAFKLGAAPFHMWAPDVYQGASSPVTLLIASVPKIAALGMLFRLFINMTPDHLVDWQKLLEIMAVISIILGNITAIVQTNFKRMLAYSSISHMGYMSLGLIAGTTSGQAAALFYMISYTLTTVGAFAIIIFLAKAGMDVGNITELKGLNTRNPFLAFIMLIIMFSMAGLPPLVGFFAKLGVLESLIATGQVWLAVIALIFAVVGSYYYLAIVKVMYFEEPAEQLPVLCYWDMQLALVFNSLVIIALSFFPSSLFLLCKSAISNL
jgi:NADH-quinone oxidoreductase subunit N